MKNLLCGLLRNVLANLGVLETQHAKSNAFFAVFRAKVWHDAARDWSGGPGMSAAWRTP
jgi:hypothetical protein